MTLSMTRSATHHPPARLSRLGSALLSAAVATTLLVGCQDSPQAMVDKAKTSIQQKDLKAAEIHLKNALQKNPDNADARALLAELYLSNRDPRSAEKEFRRALELKIAPERALPGLMDTLISMEEGKQALEAAAKYPVTQPEGKAAVAYWSGRAYAGDGDNTRATASFKEAVQLKADYYPPQIALIQLQAGSGDLTGASTAIDTVLAKAPALPEGLLLKADLQIARGDLAGGRSTLEKAIEADPRGITPRIKLISLLTDQKEFATAESQLAELTKIAPNLPIAQYFKALLDFRQNKLDSASTAIGQVLKVNPEFLPALALAANIALSQNSMEQAESYARQVAQRAPNSLQGARLLSAVYLRRGDFERAVEDPILLGIAGEASMRRNDLKAATDYLSRATTLDPKDATKRTVLGLAEISSGKIESGFNELQTAVSLDTSSTQADLALITERLRARQYDEALKAIEGLETKQPDKPLAANLRGTVLLAKGDVAGARASFEAAEKIDPKFFPAVANLAQLDLNDKKPDAARKRFEALVERDPKNVQAMVALAQLMARTGAKAEDVTALLKKAQAADPAAIEPLLALAQQQVQIGKPKDAIPLVQQALAQQPENAQLLDALGTLFLRADDKQQAIETFEKIVRMYPKSAAVQMRLGEIKAGLGDTSGALSSFRAAAELDRKATEPQFGMAAMLLKEGRKEDAEKIAKTLQKELPNSPAGLSLEGDLLSADNKWVDAAGAYRKALSIERTPALVMKLHHSLKEGGRKAEADAALREGLKATPNDNQLKMYAGDQVLAAQNWKAAAELYESVLTTNPNFVPAINNLAWCYYQLKDPKAVKYAEDAFAKAPQAAPVIDTLALVLLEKGDTQRAVELLKQATSLAPKAADIRLHYVQALAKSGDKAAAKAAAQALIKDFPDSASAKAAGELAAKL
jgi:putative PEP-CTERM system TPR-repeat lipoprotein